MLSRPPRHLVISETHSTKFFPLFFLRYPGFIRLSSATKLPDPSSKSRKKTDGVSSFPPPNEKYRQELNAEDKDDWLYMNVTRVFCPYVIRIKSTQKVCMYMLSPEMELIVEILWYPLPGNHAGSSLRMGVYCCEYGLWHRV